MDLFPFLLTLCRDSCRSSRGNCDPPRAALAFAGGGSAATPCAPQLVRGARLGRGL